MKITAWNGQPISEPGWYSGIPIARYHSAGLCAGPAVSSSNLRTCWIKSPAHMHAQWAENPDAEPRAATRAMVLGAAAHAILLGEFDTKFVAQPEFYGSDNRPWNNNANVCKEWHAQQAFHGRVPVTITELKAIVAMSKTLALEPMIDDLMRGYVECSGIVKDEETGLWIKVRPDVIPATDCDFVDLKTTSDVTTPALMSSIRSFGYHQQGALIAEACGQLGHPFEEFFLMFVETVAPHCARLVPLTQEDIGRGRKQNRAMLRRIAHCITAAHWPGPGEGDLSALPLSKDERTRIDERLTYEGVA